MLSIACCFAGPTTCCCWTAAGWALFESTPQSEHYIRSFEYVGDILAEWEAAKRSSMEQTSHKTLSRKSGAGDSPNRCCTPTVQLLLHMHGCCCSAIVANNRPAVVVLGAPTVFFARFAQLPGALPCVCLEADRSRLLAVLSVYCLASEGQ
jgi:hypothetical protein